MCVRASATDASSSGLRAPCRLIGDSVGGASSREIV